VLPERTIFTQRGAASAGPATPAAGAPVLVRYWNALPFASRHEHQRERRVGRQRAAIITPAFVQLLTLASEATRATSCPLPVIDW